MSFSFPCGYLPPSRLSMLGPSSSSRSFASVSPRRGALPAASTGSGLPVPPNAPLSAQLHKISDIPLCAVMDDLNGFEFAQLLSCSSFFNLKGKQLTSGGFKIDLLQRVRCRLVGISCPLGGQVMIDRVNRDNACYQRICGDRFPSMVNACLRFLQYREYMQQNTLEIEKAIRQEHIRIMPHTFRGEPYPYIVVGQSLLPEHRTQVDALVTAIADSSLIFLINSCDPEDNASRSVVSMLRFCRSTEIFKVVLDKLPTRTCKKSYAAPTPQSLQKAKLQFGWTNDPWGNGMGSEQQRCWNDITALADAHCHKIEYADEVFDSERQALNQDLARYTDDTHYNNLKK